MSLSHSEIVQIIESDRYLTSRRSNQPRKMAEIKKREWCNPEGDECICHWSKEPVNPSPVKYFQVFGQVHIKDKVMICEIDHDRGRIYRRGTCRVNHWFSKEIPDTYEEVVESPYDPLFL